MKKILNDPANYVEEMLDGFTAAHPESTPSLPAASSRGRAGR